MDGKLSSLGTQFLRTLSCVFERSFGENDGKFLAAEATYDIFGPEMGEKQLGKSFEHEVAGFVTIVVVEAFEMIEINQQHAEFMNAPAGAVQLAIKRVLHGATVEEAG